MSTCPHNMVNFGPLAAEIGPVVWGTPANFNGFRVLAALLHGTLVVDVSQTLRHWTEGATCIRHGGHHIGHWPTFLGFCMSLDITRQQKRRNFDLPHFLFHVWTAAVGGMLWKVIWPLARKGRGPGLGTLVPVLIPTLARPSTYQCENLEIMIGKYIQYVRNVFYLT